MNQWLRAFTSGFVATLVFHQGVWSLLFMAGAVPPPYNMTPTPPFGVPQVISLAFWGGVWGLSIWALLRAHNGVAYWARALVFGALGPSLLALAVVFPLKGQAFMAAWDIKIIVGALILNAAWGVGLAAFMRLGAK